VIEKMWFYIWKRKRISFIFLLFLVFGIKVYGQDTLKRKINSQRVLADKIIGFIGDRYILHSDVQNYIADYKRQAQANNLEDVTIPEPCYVLENLLIKKIFVLQALRDSLPLSEEEVEAALENRIRSYIYQYGSKEVLEEVANRSIFQIKEDFKEPVREQKLADLMQNKIIEAIKINPNEVEEYYNKIPKDSLAVYESEVELSQIVIHPKADPDIEVYIAKQLNDYKRQVESGAKKFDYFVKQYSEDPAAKENLGQYTLNKNDKNFDGNFFNAAFRLRNIGQVTPVIKSKFGFHIIQLIKKNGDEIVVKHILRIPPVTENEVKIVRKELDSIRTEVLNKNISFANAISKFSDDENSKFTAGSILSREGSTFVTIDELDKDIVLAIKGLNPGDITKPEVFVDDKGRKALRIIYFKNRTSPHKENLKDDYNKVAERVLNSKRQEAVQNWIQSKLGDFYLLIEAPYNTCKELERWGKQ
ncbi:MAG: peptidylprolyl isomerase, partial [Sediminibacterium sp.]|nr:peptidylprolyl isomerase [Sediminibacterium sp.]